MQAKEHGPLMTQWAEHMMESVWDIDISATKDIIRVETAYTHCTLKWDIRFNEQDQRVFFSTEYEKICKSIYHKNVIRILNDINRQCTLGRFAFDPEKGSVSYGCGINLKDVQITPEYINEIIHTISGFAHKFHPRIDKVMEGYNCML